MASSAGLGFLRTSFAPAGTQMVVSDQPKGHRPSLKSGSTIASHKQVTKRILQNFIVVLALVGVALVTVACPEKGPAEKAGEKIDDAVDKTKDAVK
jgi:hypothetical protein